MPGTRWCGTGNVSTADGGSYGNVLATDRCCQQHDRCAHAIDSFTRKYDLFNYRLHTVSHCECDDVYVYVTPFSRCRITASQYPVARSPQLQLTSIRNSACFATPS